MRKHKQYLSLCLSIAKTFSTCSKRQYGAVLVDESGHVVGIGYNGGPSGYPHCKDGACPRLHENSANGSNYDNCIAIHAEANALLHSDYSARAKILYVNGPPCFSCAKLIANSTVDKIVYLKDDSYLQWGEVEKFLVSSNVDLLGIDHASI